MSVVKVTGNSQITIPKEIRKEAGIKEGDRFEVSVVENGVLIRRMEMYDVTGFFPWGFKEIIAKSRKDSRDRLSELGVIPRE